MGIKATVAANVHLGIAVVYAIIQKERKIYKGIGSLHKHAPGRGCGIDLFAAHFPKKMAAGVHSGAGCHNVVHNKADTRKRFFTGEKQGFRVLPALGAGQSQLPSSSLAAHQSVFDGNFHQPPQLFGNKLGVIISSFKERLSVLGNECDEIGAEISHFGEDFPGEIAESCRTAAEFHAGDGPIYTIGIAEGDKASFKGTPFCAFGADGHGKLAPKLCSADLAARFLYSRQLVLAAAAYLRF